MAVIGPAPLGSIGRTVMHVVGVALGWLLFLYGWIRVAARPWDAYELWVLIVASAIVLPTLTAIWIAHNVALYRGRHRRRGVAIAECRYDVDWAGQAVEADWNALASAERIWIDVEGGTKWYRSFATLPLPPASQGSSPAHGLVPSASLDTEAAP